MSVGDISRRQANRGIPGNIRYISFCHYTFSAGTTFSHGINMYICDRTCEKGPCRASFQNRVITTIGKSRL